MRRFRCCCCFWYVIHDVPRGLRGQDHDQWLIKEKPVKKETISDLSLPVVPPTSIEQHLCHLYV